MESFKIGFIGCGNMGGALALSAVKTLGGENVLVACRTNESTAAASKKTGATPSTLKEIAKECRLIFLGVKPNMIGAISDEIKETLKCRCDEWAAVSMAAGVTIESLSEMLYEGARIIRMMPNTSVAVGEGMIVYAHRATDSDVLVFKKSMSATGVVSEISEELIDAATAVMGCGPAFAYQFADALMLGGVKCGLSREDAELYAAQMLLGAAKMMLSSDKSPIELRDAVCSPGGSTIEGVKLLEAEGLRDTVMKAVEASYKRTQELGKK
jgi:pyrroline-5-carboxylate reductase